MFSGASGEVYKAMLRGTEVAVKKLAMTNTSKEAQEEFEFESAIMAYVERVFNFDS